MNSNTRGILGLIAILVFFVAVSGCISFLSDYANTSYNLNNTFSKDGISFNYPDNFIDRSATAIVDDDAYDKGLVCLTSPNNKTTIYVSSRNLVSLSAQVGYPITIKEIKDYSYKIWQNSTNTQIVSERTLNLSGIPEAYEIIDTSTNPENNEYMRVITLWIGKPGQVYYDIQFTGSNENFENTQALYDKVLPTIKMETIK